MEEASVPQELPKSDWDAKGGSSKVEQIKDMVDLSREVLGLVEHFCGCAGSLMTFLRSYSAGIIQPNRVYSDIEAAGMLKLTPQEIRRLAMEGVLRGVVLSDGSARFLGSGLIESLKPCLGNGEFDFSDNLLNKPGRDGEIYGE